MALSLDPVFKLNDKMQPYILFSRGSSEAGYFGHVLRERSPQHHVVRLLAQNDGDMSSRYQHKRLLKKGARNKRTTSPHGSPYPCSRGNMPASTHDAHGRLSSIAVTT